MPGHVKKSTGPDPDPSPWLIVSDELKVKLKAKPYDAKKSCWVPNKGTGGYDEGLIESTDGDKVSVKLLGGDVSLTNLYNIAKVSMYDDFFIRPKSSRRTWLVKSILPSLTALKIWLV